MSTNKKRTRLLSLLLCIVLGIAAMSVPLAIGSYSTVEQAHAIEVSVGGEPISGAWEPSDIITSNVNVNMDAKSVQTKAENSVVKFVKIIMPILMIACVCIIIYNAIRNLFLPKEKRTLMGDVIKNMFIQFFFILFAWIIVEGIVFVITGGETILFSIIMG